MYNNPLLSICIPTYNQPKEVERLLNTLSKQVPRDGSVELVVRDDSPNEETKKIVDSFEDLKIRYFHGEKGGLDKAIIALTQEAKGEYVWWLGDDDLADNAVAKILEVFKEHPEVSFLLLNYRLFSRPNPERAFKNGFLNKDQMLELANGALGFISVTLFKRSYVEKFFPLAEKYAGSAFSNLCMALGVLSESESVYFISEPLVINYPNKPEQMNSDGFEVFGISFLKILKEFSKKFSRRSMRNVLVINFRNVWKGVFVRWVTGYESPRGKKLKMLKYYWNFLDIVPAILLLNLPLFVNKFFYKLYRSCKK